MERLLTVSILYLWNGIISRNKKIEWTSDICKQCRWISKIACWRNKPNIKEYMWFYFYEIHKEEKLIYVDENQNSGCLEKWDSLPCIP